MRIRSIKPEFWRSDDITALAWTERLLFIGLWSYVDDNGVGLDKLASITADLFAGDIERDSSEAFERVSRGLQKLSDASRITRYTVEGKRFIHITNWDKHQRIDKPNKSRYPLPTRDNAMSSEILAEPSRDAPESPAPGTGEQGNRGTVKKTYASPKVDDAFNEFWNLYPRKKGKDKALDSLRKALKKTSLEEIMSGLQATLPEWEGKEPDFVPYPATWLNQGRWQDEVSETKQDKSGEVNVEAVLGRDLWMPPAPPDDLPDGEYGAWVKAQREAHDTERREEARRRSA